ERLRAAAPKRDELVVFTAHSLPKKAVESGDPYVDQVTATARGVADRVGLSGYTIAYQSAGRTPEPWIGPTIDEMIDEQTGRGVRKFLIAPIGFVCDHTEILYDVDIQAAQTAREFSTALRRSESLNTSATFISML